MQTPLSLFLSIFTVSKQLRTQCTDRDNCCPGKPRLSGGQPVAPIRSTATSTLHLPCLALPCALCLVDTCLPYGHQSAAANSSVQVGYDRTRSVLFRNRFTRIQLCSATLLAFSSKQASKLVQVVVAFADLTICTLVAGLWPTIHLFIHSGCLSLSADFSCNTCVSAVSVAVLPAK